MARAALGRAAAVLLLLGCAVDFSAASRREMLQAPAAAPTARKRQLCPAGSWGPNCKQKCRADTYGIYLPCKTPNCQSPTHVCRACPEGSTTDGAVGQSRCAVCLPGRGGETCDLCPAGWYSMGGENVVCKRCAPGTFAPAIGTRECLPCDPGFESGTGSTGCYCKPGFGGDTCKPCPLNMYSPGGPGAQCTRCPGSSYTLTDTSSTCVCLAGTGLSRCADSVCPCEPCPLGFYSKGGAAAACTKCGPGMTTTETGADSEIYCQCRQGYGANLAKSGCDPCPIGQFSTGPPPVTAAAKAAAVKLGDLSPPYDWLMSCQVCPGGANAVTKDAGSTSPDQCLCKPGSGGLACNTCPADTYGPGGARTAECVNCPDGTTTLTQTAQSTLSSCVTKACLDGYGRQTGASSEPCLACGTDPSSGRATFSQNGLCVACGPNTGSPTLAKSYSDCFCLLGYGVPAGYNAVAGSGACQQCPLNTYSTGTGSLTNPLNRASCQPCPFGTRTLQAGSGSITACVAKPGYYADSTQPNADGSLVIKVCDANSYCPGGTNDNPKGNIIQCKSGYTSPNGSSTVDQCAYGLPKCNTGYGRTQGSTDETCLPCGPNIQASTATYADNSGTGWCLSCGANTGSKALATSVNDCYCLVGYGVAASYRSNPSSADACQECPLGTYSEGQPTGKAACTPCPVGTRTLQTKSTSKQQCVAMPGYYIDVDTNTAVECPVNNYCPGGTNDKPFGSIVQCKAGYTTATKGSSTVDQCNYGLPKCDNGYGRTQGTTDEPCLPCGYNAQTDSATYADNSGTGFCVTCGPFSTARAMAMSINDCSCKSGYGVPDGTAPLAIQATSCQQCPVNTYAVPVAGGGKATCKACPPNTKTFQAGSTGVDACVPIPGFVVLDATNRNPDGSYIVTLCAQNAYCPGATSDSPLGTMVACTDGYKSPPGSKAATECIPGLPACPPGGYGRLTGALGEACAPCGGVNSQTGAGTYANNDWCVTCGPNTGSKPLASSSADCYCKDGYGIPPSTASGSSALASCQQCPQNTYADTSVAGLARCLPCPPGTRTLQAGSTSAAACVAAPGFYVNLAANSVVAEVCPTNYTCAGGTNDNPAGSKTACQDGYSAPAGSTSQSDCIPGLASCKITGYGRTTGSISEICLPCGFSASSGQATYEKDDWCISCGSNTGAPSMASAFAQCYCQAGFGAPLGVTVSPTSGISACQECPINTYSVSAGEGTSVVDAKCVPCPVNTRTLATRSTSPAACLASPGYYFPSGTTTPTICDPGYYCPGGTTDNPGGNRIKCQDTYTSAAGATTDQQCFYANTPCATGYGRTPGQPQSACAPCGLDSTGTQGTYAKDGFCVSCGPNTAAPTLATAYSQCYCVAGYGVPPGFTPGSGGSDACQQCPLNTYSSGGTTRTACQSCSQYFKTDQTGSTSINQCNCIAGYYWQSGSCYSCPAGYYCPGGSTANGLGPRGKCDGNQPCSLAMATSSANCYAKDTNGNC